MGSYPVVEYYLIRFPYARSGKSDVWKPLGNGSAVTSRLFTGREYDPETGLFYYRARVYFPVLGRFLQRDPIGTADQVNLYAYVANNPLKWTDPMGKEKEMVANIFRNSTYDFAPLGELWYPFWEKQDEWTRLNFNEYDLVHYDTKDTKLVVTPTTHITSDKMILIDGAYYSLWEVSNILVWFNAYNAGYQLEALNVGGMLHTFWAETTDPSASNWIVGEYMDEYLYAAGYELAKTSSKLGVLSTEMVTTAVEVGTNARYWGSQNYGITDAVSVGFSESVSFLITGIYSGYNFITQP